MALPPAGDDNRLQDHAQSKFDSVQNQMGIYFEKQLTDWQAFDSSKMPIRALFREDWAVDAKGVPYLTPSYLEKINAEREAAMNVVKMPKRVTAEELFE